MEKDLNGPDVVKASAQHAKVQAFVMSRSGGNRELETHLVQVRLDTTKGQIVLKLVPSWSPNGVRRMLELVDDGFFKAR